MYAQKWNRKENKGFVANSLWIFVWGEINTFLTRNWVIKRPVMHCGCGIPGLMVMYQRPSLDRIFGWWGRQAHFLSIYQGVKWNFIELIWSLVPLIIVRKGEWNGKNDWFDHIHSFLLLAMEINCLMFVILFSNVLGTLLG